MKHFLMVVALLWSIGAGAQESGIQFYKDSRWADLLAKAKSENKLIVVDAYTTWCGPCKMMDRNIFTDKEVGQFYNANFINAKFDMEAGEGLKLAETYQVRAYPTILFIDGSGKAMHRMVGFKQAAAFLEVGHIALDPDKRLAGLERRLDAGERDPAFIAEVITAFQESMHPRTAEVSDLYLDAQTDWTTPENVRLVVENTHKTDSKRFKFLLENRAVVEKEYGANAYLQILAQVILQEAFPDMETAGLPSNEKMAEAFRAKLPAALAAQTSLLVEMIIYKGQQDTKNYAAKAVEYFKKYPSNDYNQLNEEAWAFYELVEDKEMLKEAVKWAEKSVQLRSLYFNNDTLASLYYKIGDQKKAKKTAEKAIELAKAGGEDDTATQELLEKINKMK